MASYRLLLVNNVAVQISGNYLYTSGSSASGIYVISKNKQEDKTEELQSIIEATLEYERGESLYKYVTQTQPIEQINSLLKIHAIYTPLYYLKKQLADSGDKKKIIRNSETMINEDITAEWNRSYKLQFIANEIVKYSNLVPIVSPMINSSLKYNTYNPALLLRYDNNKVLYLYYFDDSIAIINPFKWLPNIEDTKLFQLALNPESFVPLEGLDNPMVFKVPTHRDTLINLMGTKYDILALCNINNNNIPFSEQNIIRLIGGLALTEIGGTNENINLPLKGPIYYVFGTDSDNNRVITNITLDKSSIELGYDDEVSERNLIQHFLLGIFGGEDMNKYVGLIEGGKLLR